MKIVAGILLFVLCSIVAQAQDAKVVAEIAASHGNNTVKNAPFSAEAISESVQTLADGNRIVRSSTSKLYRNSEGRFRREVTGGTGGMLGSFYTFGQGVTLLDPVGGFRYSIDPNLRTTTQTVIRPRGEVRIVTTPSAQSLQGVLEAAKVRGDLKTGADGQTVISDKVREEIRAAISAGVRVAPGAPVPPLPPLPATAVVAPEPLTTVGVPFAVRSDQNPKWETRTEQLGIQTVEGVEAEGTRTITTIPAGAIGNERPIEITYEKWFSKELQLVVMSKHSDPRFGEQTYRLTNIIRSEPDPSLFTLPNGYRMVTDQSGTKTYTVTARAGEKAAGAARATPVSNAVSKTKP
jgi:hypothetical protein